jgi:hypothetical protein
MYVESGRAALWTGDLAGAKSDLDAFRSAGISGRYLEMTRWALEAGVAATEGRRPEALSAYRGTLRGLREMRIDFTEALTCLDMVFLIGPGEPEVDAAADRAREILTGLRAAPYLRMLDEALERAGATTTAAPHDAASPESVATG